MRLTHCIYNGYFILYERQCNDMIASWLAALMPRGLYADAKCTKIGNLAESIPQNKIGFLSVAM